MSISFSGLASGLDTSSWVQSLTALKQAKVTVLQEEREEIVSTRDLLKNIKSFFSSFRSTIEKITDSRFNIAQMDLFAQNLANSTNLDKITATATHEAVEGKYEVKVDKLASNTKAQSSCKRNTTIVERTVANEDTLLSTIGVNAGRIMVTNPTNGISSTIRITENDTIGTFIEKLEIVGGEGIDASISKNGVFTVNLGPSNIVDLEGTNIVDALHLEGVNEGYTSNRLQVEHKETVWDPATTSTKLSDLGVSAGTIGITANDAAYNINITNASTIGSFLSDLQGKGIDATFKDGIFRIENAEITDEGTTNIKTAFNMTEEISGKSQISNDLAFETTVVTQTIASADTKLADLGYGLTVNNGDTVVVQDSNGNNHTITLNSNSSVGDLLEAMETNGLDATIKSDGTVEITGGKILNTGSFDAISALGLNEEAYTAYVTGNALTETVTVPEIVTLATEFVDDLKVTEGLLQVTDAEGTTHYLEIYDGLSIGEFIADLGNLGILGELDETTGVLTITGGEFDSLTQSEINTLSSQGKLNGVSLRTATDLLDLLFPDMGAATDVVQTFAVSRPLSRSVTNTILAEADTTTLGSLGLTGNETAVFNVRGTNVNVNVNPDMTINEFITALDNAGISASFDEDTHKLTIQNATLTSTGELADILDLTPSTSGKYTASVATYADSTIKINATTATTFEQLGILDDQTIEFYDETGKIATYDATKDTTIGDIIGAANTAGLTATIENGVIKIEGGYIKNSAVEEVLGLDMTSSGVSHLLGTQKTDTETLSADRTTKLSSLVGANITGNTSAVIKNVDGDTVTTLTFDKDDTLGSVFDQLDDYGISASITNGVISLTSASGNYITEDSTFATKLGIRTETQDVIVSNIYNSSNLNASKTLTTSRETTLAELGITDYALTINETDGDTITTTFTSGTNIGTILDWCSNNGVSASLSDGVISLSSATGAYVTGTLATAFGITTETMTETTTIGVQQSGTAETVNATTDTLIKDILGDEWSDTAPNNIIAVYDSKNPSNPLIGSVTIQDDMTVGDMITALAAFGIQGTMTDGVITLTNKGGNIYAADAYPDGNGILAKLGIETANTSVLVTETIGNVVAGEAQTYETTVVATSDALLVELGKTIAAGDTLEIYDRIDGVIGTFTVTETSTIKDLQDVLAENGIATTMKDGVLTFDNTNGYVDGTVADKLGIETTGQTITTTIGTNATQTQEITYSYYTVASEDTTFGDLGLITEGAESIVTVNGAVSAGFIVNTNTYGLSTSSPTFTEAFETYGMDVSTSGTIAYRITTVEDLRNLTGYVSNGGSTKDMVFCLGADLDFNGGDFLSIGDEENPFEGYFFGNGHVIKNVNLVSTSNFVGLFGVAKNAVIQDLGIENATFNINFSKTAGGILVGMYQYDSTFTQPAQVYSTRGIIHNVYTSGVLDFEEGSCNIAGGVVGLYSASATATTAAPSMTAVCSDAFVRNYTVAGGIIGIVDGGIRTNLLLSMNKAIVGDDYYEGGIIGYANNTSASLSQWYNTCYVIDNFETADYKPYYVFGYNSNYTTIGILRTELKLTDSGQWAANTLSIVQKAMNTRTAIASNMALQGAAQTKLNQIFFSGQPITFTSESTIGEFLDAINENGIIATLENGVININNAAAGTADGVVVDNVYLEGDLITAMGMTSTDHAVEDFNEIITSTLAVTHTKTTTVGNTLTSTAAITYTGLISNYATEDTTLRSLGIDTTDDNIVVADGIGLNDYGLISSPTTFIATGTSLASVSSTSTITSGTYAISTTSELKKLATMTNNGYIQGGTFVLVKDLDLSGIDWTPIGKQAAGTAEYQFHGKFYGQGHSISNMNCTGDYQYAGLFGLNRGTIQDLILIDCTVDQSNTSVTDSLGGIVCGQNLGSTSVSSSIGTINNIAVVNGKVVGPQIGGLAGGNNGTLKNSWTTSTVDCLTNNSWNTCGGLVSHTANGAYFYNCYALNESVDSSSQYSAGLIAYFGSAGGTVTINNCYVGNTGADRVFAYRNAEDYTINCSGLTYSSLISSASLGTGITATATVNRTATIIDGFNSSTTLGELMDAIGWDYTIENGVITAYSEGSTNTETYETYNDYLRGSIIKQLGLTNQKITSPDTGQSIWSYYNTTALVTNTTGTVTLCSETTFADLGLSGELEIEIDGINNIYYQVDEGESIYDFFNSIGATATITDGKLVLEPPEEYQFVSFMDDNGDDVWSYLNIDSSQFGTTTATQTITMTSKTTLASLGVTSTQTISIKNTETGAITAHTIGSSTSIYNALNNIEGLTAMIDGGKMKIIMDDGYCVTGMSASMVTKLKFLKDTANIDSNKLCGDVSGTGLKRSLCLDQLVSSGGSWTIWDAATDSSHTVIEYTTDMSVGDFLDALAQGGVYSYIEDGKVTFVQGEKYIKNEDDSLWQKLFGTGANSNAFEDETILYDYENDPSDTLNWTHTVTMDYDSTLDQLGVTSNGGINIHVKNEDGTTETVTVSYTTDMTIGELLEELEAYGIYGKIENGVLSFIPVGENYIVDMSNNNSFESGLGINLTDATTTRSYYKWDMSPSDTLSANLTSNTTFVELGVASGTEMIVTVNSAGTDVLVTIKAENTLSDFMAGLAGAGISSEIKDGIFTIKGSKYAYIKDMNDTLAGALGLTTTDSAYYTTQGDGTIINTNSTAHKTYSKTLPITGDTLLTNIAGITTSDTLVVTKPDGTTSTIAVGTGDTVSDFFTKLSQCGLTGSVDTDGKISIVGQGDTTISGTVADKLGLSLTTIKDTITTNTNSNALTEIKTVNMHDGTTLEELGIIDNGGKLKLFKDGVEHTITLVDGWTIADFRDKLAEFGITSEIVDGRLSLTTNGVARFEEVDSDAVAQLGLTNWSTVGSFSQESDQLSDISVLHPAATLQSRIEELTDADGDNLGITNGNIYVYQDGTRHTFAIDKSETLGTLASRLASYGITLSIDQDGVISFAGNGNSYMESVTGGSNIIDILGIDNWTEVNDYTSKNLKYEEDDTATINGDTKMVDILGGSEAVTTGKYNVVANGVTTTEEITDDTTVNDFIATLSTYGMTASVNSDGQIAVGGQNNTYLMTSNYATGNSNVVQALFTEWEFVNVYESNNLEIPTPVIESITRDTKLSNINEGTYQEGLITVVKDGVQINVTLTADDTVGTFMDTLELHGFNCVLNDSGQLTVMSTGDSIIKNYNGTGASNALDLLGVESSDWVTTNMYSGEAIDVIEEATYNTAVARDTELSELGITTGEYYIYNNGVRYSALVSSDETVGSFLETLATFGIQGNLVSNGTYAVLELKGSGESYIEKSSSVNNASNIADILFPDASDTTYNYEASLKTDRIVTTYNDVTEETLISDVYTTWTDNVNKAQGELSVTIDGETLGLNIAADETFGSLINRLNSMGLEATLMNGELMIQSGYAEFTINSAGTTSNIVNDLGLAYHDDLGGYMQSNDTVISTTTHDEIVDESVSQWANYDTKMSQLNISSGTLSIYKNGEKATIQVDENETFGQLRSRIATAHSGVDIKFEDGYLTFFSTAGDSVEVGATTDTSNIMAICGLSNDKSGTVKSGRELYRVNGSSKIADTGLFRRGNVTEGTFVIGNQTFEITENTTLNNLISQINASEDANATASWDSIAGKLVITSRSTGAALINIEAGTSNFTDIMGLTTTERNPDNSVITTKINVDSQEIGDNASFSINGTHYNSTSNTIGSDLTRITGLTINLKGVTEGSSVTLTVERDKETVANAVSDVVDAYNELIEKVDKEVARGGKLAKESTLKLIRNQIRTLMTSSLAGASVFKNLDQVGISSEAASANNINTDKVDVLYFDKAKFIEAFDADRDALKNLIVGTDSDLGIFSKIETVLESSLAGVYGYFDSATKSYDNQISRLDDKIEKATKAVERYKLRLEAKFSAMDRLIASIQNQYSNFLG